MKKYLIAAATALLALAMVAVAVAQNPAPPVQFEASQKPTKAGTKKKPRPTTIDVSMSVPAEANATADQIVFHLPGHVRVSGKGFRYCPATRLDATKDPSQCPKGSQVGEGSATVMLGSSQQTLDLTMFAGSANELAIWLQGTGGLQGVQKGLRGIISRSGKPYYQKLTIDITQDVQQPIPGLYSNLTNIQADIGGTNGKKGRKRRNLIEVIGCPKNKKHKWETRVRFIEKPGVATAGVVPQKTTSRCSKA